MHPELSGEESAPTTTDSIPMNQQIQSKGKNYSTELMISLAAHAVILFAFSLIVWQEAKPPVIPTFITSIPKDTPPPVIDKLTPIEMPNPIIEPIKDPEPDPEVTDEIVVTDAKPDDAPVFEDTPYLAADNSFMGDISTDAPPAFFGWGKGPNGEKGLSGRPGDGGIGDGDLKRENVPHQWIPVLQNSLNWLAEHQEADGSWDAAKYEGSQSHHFAMTGAALLAFLGAGETEKIGKYKNTLRKGFHWLNQAVERGDRGYNNYAHAIGLMALSEGVMLGSRSITRMNANTLAKELLGQYTDKGWAYKGSGVDLSVSGWVVLGLKSARDAELECMKDPQAIKMFQTYNVWLDTMTPAETGIGNYRPDRAGGPHMSWAGMVQRQFLGLKDDGFNKKADALSVEWTKTGKWVGGAQPGDVYGIYYGTLALYNEHAKGWLEWKKPMEQTLLKSQLPGDPKLLGGSWNPGPGSCSKHGGRVLTTAMLAICLEVYWRHSLDG